MAWIVVRNWENFQAYKDRTVPWIKLYAELQHDDSWLQLPPGRRGMLVSLWLEYMFSRCRLRADTAELSRRLNARVRQDDLEALSEAGFITILSEPSPTHVRLMSDLAYARASLVREEKKRKEEKTPPTPPGGKEQGKKTDELWEILVEELGEVQTDSERGRRNKALKEIRDANATPDDLRFAIRVYRELWPAITLTASALAANWTMLMNGSSRTPAFKFHCAECGVGANTEQRLTEHMENVHGVWA